MPSDIVQTHKKGVERRLVQLQGPGQQRCQPVGLQQDNTGAPWLMYSCLRTEGTCLALLFYRESSRNRLREFHTKLSVGSAEHSGP
ncbi:unnamed protein product [Arctogadus glacialis]